MWAGSMKKAAMAAEAEHWVLLISTVHKRLCYQASELTSKVALSIKKRPQCGFHFLGHSWASTELPCLNCSGADKSHSQEQEQDGLYIVRYENLTTVNSGFESLEYNEYYANSENILVRIRQATGAFTELLSTLRKVGGDRERILRLEEIVRSTILITL